ncbi:MAG: SAP domain-containing protein [Nitrospirae bacterium]|nr:SAP domain-containing protein [Nitrospirota bacterium]
MNLKEIKEIAKKKGIKAGKMSKEDIIRFIQRAEGNFECFGTALSGECSQTDCAWRSDCLNQGQ